MMELAPTLGCDGNLSIVKEAAVELKMGKSYQLFVISMPMIYQEDQTKDVCSNRVFAFLPDKRAEVGFKFSGQRRTKMNTMFCRFFRAPLLFVGSSSTLIFIKLYKIPNLKL
jgi:hypothetical protein